MKRFSFVATGLVVLLAACSDLRGVATPVSSSEPLNVAEVNGRWVVKSGSEEAAALWRSQNPLGKTVTMQFADADGPVTVTIKGERCG